MKKRTNLCLVLRDYGLSMKDFSNWLGVSQEGLSRAIKQQESRESYSKNWEWAIKGFLMEKGKGGFNLEHTVFIN